MPDGPAERYTPRDCETIQGQDARRHSRGELNPLLADTGMAGADRQFYNDKSTGQAMPGKKGISLSLEQVRLVPENRQHRGSRVGKAAELIVQWKALRGSVHQIDEIVNKLEP